MLPYICGYPSGLFSDRLKHLHSEYALLSLNTPKQPDDTCSLSHRPNKAAAVLSCTLGSSCHILHMIRERGTPGKTLRDWKYVINYTLNCTSEITGSRHIRNWSHSCLYPSKWIFWSIHNKQSRQCDRNLWSSCTTIQQDAIWMPNLWLSKMHRGLRVARLKGGASWKNCVEEEILGSAACQTAI